MAHEQPALDDGRFAAVCRSRNRGLWPQVARREFWLAMEPRRRSASLDRRQRARRRRRRHLGSKLHAERLAHDATHSAGGVALPFWRRALARHLPKQRAARRASLYRAFGRSFAPRLSPRIQFAARMSVGSILAAARQGAREAEGRRSDAFSPAKGNAFSNLREAHAGGFSGGRIFRRGGPGAVWITDLAGGKEAKAPALIAYDSVRFEFRDQYADARASRCRCFQ